MSAITEYRKLLLEYQPEIIRSERVYRRVLAQVERLMVLHPNRARSRIIELLSTLVENYESKNYPTPQASPEQMLQHLLDSRQIKCAEVAKQTGVPPATLSNVLARRRGISKDNALKLAKYFAVSPAVFFGELRC